MDASQRDRARLLKAILERAERGRFLPSMAMLERLFPDAVRVGLDGPARLEAIRFRSDPSLGFAAGDMKHVRVTSLANGLEPPRHVVEVETTFLGLTGAGSPLPNYLVEAILLEAEGSTRRDFLDVFHHRLVSLLYRGLARASLPLEETVRAPNVWRRRALALGGLDAYDADVTKALPTESVLRMLPLLASRARSARGLRTALRHVLEPALGARAGVELVENLPGWLTIEPAHRVRLGQANHALGRETHIGSRAPERSGRFGVRIGPLDPQSYPRFLPGGDQLPRIAETIQLFTRSAAEYELQLVVGASSSPTFRLSATRPASLGRTTWLAGGDDEHIVTVSHADVGAASPAPATSRGAAPTIPPAP